MKLKLTNAGQELLSKVLNNDDKIEFCHLEIGNGDWLDEEEIKGASELHNRQMRADVNLSSVTENDTGDKFIELDFTFNNYEQEADFRITELGVFAKNQDNDEILYAIGTEKEETADNVPSKDKRKLEFELKVSLYIGDSENVSAVINDSLAYVTLKAFNDHIDDYSNPHKVNKNHVGLGNVHNLAPSDLDPEFTEAEQLENINSKEPLKIVLGKVKKAIASLISHLNNTNNPHKLNHSDVEAAAEKHTHSTVDIKAGVLSVLRGGTGREKFDKNAVIIGNDKEGFNSVKGDGAFFSYGDEKGPKFDTLPVLFGGTGLKEGAKFDSSLDYGCFGSVVLPGGLLVQWGRLKIEAGEGKSPKIEFEKSFADKKYALLFTTSSGSEGSAADMPSWNVPTKETDYFYMYHPFGHVNSIMANHVADWVAFGKAAENN